MSRKIQIYKIASRFSSTLWFLVGIITLGSIYNGLDGVYINIVIGLIFLSISMYTLLKAKNINRIISFSDSINEGKKITYNRLLLLESIFTFISITVGLIALSAVISRTFGEGLPVFG